MQKLSYIASQGTERQLLEALRRGDPASYRQLYETHAPRLLRLLQRITRDEGLAHDALQCAFLIVFEKLDGFAGRSSLSTWMTQIGIREAQRLVRQSTPRELPAEPAPEPRRCPESESIHREASVRLNSLIAALPVEKRAALILFEVEGLTAREVAEVLDEPLGTVLARLSRTRAELRETMRDWAGLDEGLLGGGAHG